MKDRVRRPQSGNQAKKEKMGGTMNNMNRLTIATSGSGRTSMGSTMPLKGVSIGARRYSNKSGKGATSIGQKLPVQASLPITP